jgi:ABC-type sulfate transport system permease subunit
MQTVFAGLRLLGVPLAAAYAGHFAIAAIATCAVVWAWATHASERLRWSLLFVCTFLISPYAYWYDLVWLAFPIAWIALEALRTGWRRWEREILLAAWLMPMLTPLLAMWLGVPLGPVVLLAFAAIILRRVRMP